MCCVPQDPGAAGEEAKQGRIGFDFGTLFQKGQHLGTGQCPVKRYNQQLRDLIIKRIDGYTKVLLHP